MGLVLILECTPDILWVVLVCGLDVFRVGARLLSLTGLAMSLILRGFKGWTGIFPI